MIQQISIFFALLPNEEYFYFLLLLIIAVMTYIIFLPLMNWLITLRTTKLLTYFLSSLSVLLIICVLLIATEESRITLLELIKVGLQSLAIFGLLIVIYNLFITTFKKIGIKK